ncbi:hypothetical protein BV25DRAFT_1825067 [Artomyces pyxidatus]|uniref:Uncharacterized protein n=1 Tax=Artomyces pyxidatus TaxID=48021 RepID=A0ACB8T2C6_9AGAM|nr:hypothetical protein BV25DRAFT_1825067 [Artomyces pyxidatus]
MEATDGHRNAESPISRLPVELLRAIFLTARQKDISKVMGTAHLLHDAMPPWVVISQVCRHWRHIALDTKELWTEIPVQSCRTMWTELALSRSDPLSISLCFDFNLAEKAWYKDAVLRAARALPRARELFITGGCQHEHSFLAAFVAALRARRAPHLEVFAADFFEEMPDDMFLDDPPDTLRTVRLFTCNPSAHSVLFRAPLRSLQLLDCTTEIVRVLAGCPTLESVLLSGSSYTEGAGPLDYTHAALQRLTVVDDFESVVGLLRLLRLAPSVQLLLDCYAIVDERTIYEAVTDVVELLSDHVAPAPDTGVLPFAYLVLNLNVFQGSAFALYRSTDTALGPQVRFSFDWERPDRRVGRNPMLFALEGMEAALRGVQTLWFRSREAHTAREWADLSRLLGQVTYIRVKGNMACRSVVTMLGDETQATLLFPHLEVLVIEHTALSPVRSVSYCRFEERMADCCVWSSVGQSIRAAAE